MTNPSNQMFVNLEILDAYDELVRLTERYGIDTVRQLVDRVVERQTSAPPEKPVKFVKPEIPAKPAHQATGDGCPWCGLDIGKNTMFRHLNNAHRDDLEQLYVDEGTKGLQTVFGVPYGRAYGWACKLDGEAA